jgi:LysM repeat protein
MHKAFPFCGALALSFVVAGGLAAQSLKGSPASIDRMYRQAMSQGLSFFETSAGVRRAVASGDLTRLDGSFRLKDVSQPYVLPTTRTFAQRLAVQYREQCGAPMVVTSGVRPQSMHLSNSTSKTVHPTGMAVDLRRPGSSRCLGWLRRTLSSLESQGILEATEEHHPAHFHVAVFPAQYARYLGGAAAPARLASASAPAARRQKPAQPASTDRRAYRVRQGDSLWTIARRTNVSVAVLRDANSLRSPRIVAGQLLVIPVGH